MTLRRIATTTAVFATVLAAWWLAGVFALTDPFLLPPPGRVAATLVDLAASGDLARHTLVSLRRVLFGYGLAVALAVPLAVVFALSRPLRDTLEPLLEFIRQIPPLALIPLSMLWLGIGEEQKVGIIVLACFFPIFLGLGGGIAEVDPRLIEVGRVCGLSRAAVMRRIVLPAALPATVVGLRLGLGYSWRALVGAELVASSAGLGYMIVDAEALARTDIVLAGILMIGVIGLVSDLLLKQAIARAAPWLAAPLEAARA